MRIPTSRRTLVEFLQQNPSTILVDRGVMQPAPVPAVNRRQFVERRGEHLYFTDANTIIRHVVMAGDRWDIAFHADRFDVFRLGSPRLVPLSYYYRPSSEAVGDRIPFILRLAYQGLSIPDYYIDRTGFVGTQEALRAAIIAGQMPIVTPGPNGEGAEAAAEAAEDAAEDAAEESAEDSAEDAAEESAEDAEADEDEDETDVDVVTEDGVTG